jgi:hypothetical protein
VDLTRIDRLARSLAERRTVVRTLAGLPLVAVATGADRGAISAAARQRQKKKGNRKPACSTGEVRLAGTCVRFCDVCANGCLFNRIPLALASASAGVTVILCPETFTETVNVLKNVTLVGAARIRRTRCWRAVPRSTQYSPFSPA